MRKSTLWVFGACFIIATSSAGVYGQGRQRPAPTTRQARPPITPDRREDIRDRREDVRDRQEDVRDRREDVRDRREDVRDRQTDGGIRDRREDVRDRREDGRDRREDVRDRREDLRDRLEDRIDRDPRFAAHVRDIMPPDIKPGDAFDGFNSHGQFFAALHVSKNLDIPFRQLKTTMMSDENMSLGKAIHELRPDMSEADVRQAVQKSEKQAQDTEKSAD